MPRTFERITWREDQSPYLNAENLNRIEAGLAEVFGLAESGQSHAHPLTSATDAGFFSPEEKMKLSGIESGATEDMTPQEIRAALAGVGGAGSGIDADFLDGLDASAFIRTTTLGAASGVAQLGPDGKLLPTQTNSLSISEPFTVSSEAAMLALSPSAVGRGDLAIRTDFDPDRVYILAGDGNPGVLANWVRATFGDVVSVNGQVGVVVLSAASVGAIDASARDAANGVAPLDANRFVPLSRLSGITASQIAAASVDGLAATASMRTLGTGAQQAMPGNALRGHALRGNGTLFAQRGEIDFTGSGVSVNDDSTNGKTVVNISSGSGGASLSIQDEGAALTQRTILNFTGSGVAAADDSANGRTNVTINSPPAATDGVAGVVKLASTSDSDTAANNTLAMTPLMAARNMLRLNQNEVVVTGGQTLLSSAIQRMHVCSGTSYTVTLPSPSTLTGRCIAFRITASGLVTLSSSSEIDGQTTRVMWSGETAVLLSTGSTWTKIAGRSRPMAAQTRLTNASTPQAAQSVPNATITTVNQNTVDFDSGGLADTANNQILIRRPGMYVVNALVTFAFGGASPRAVAIARRTSDSAVVVYSESSVSATNVAPLASGTEMVSFAAADSLTLQCLHTTGSARHLIGEPNSVGSSHISVAEITSW